MIKMTDSDFSETSSSSSSSSGDNIMGPDILHQRGCHQLMNSKKKYFEMSSNTKNNYHITTGQVTSNTNSTNNNHQNLAKPRYLRNTEASRRKAVIADTSCHQSSEEPRGICKARRRYRGGIEGGGGGKKNSNNSAKNKPKDNNNNNPSSNDIPVKYPMIFYSSNYQKINSDNSQTHLSHHEDSTSRKDERKHCDLRKSKIGRESQIEQSKNCVHRSGIRSPNFQTGYQTPVNSPCTVVEDDFSSSTPVTPALNLNSRTLDTGTGSTTFIHVNSNIRGQPENIGWSKNGHVDQKDQADLDITTPPRLTSQVRMEWPNNNFEVNVSRTSNHFSNVSKNVPLLPQLRPGATAYRISNGIQDRNQVDDLQCVMKLLSSSITNENRPKTPPPRQLPPPSPYFDCKQDQSCHTKIRLMVDINNNNLAQNQGPMTKGMIVERTQKRNHRHRIRNKTIMNGNDSQISSDIMAAGQKNMPKTKSRIINGQYVIVSRHNTHNSDRPSTRKWCKSATNISKRVENGRNDQESSSGYLIKIPGVGGTDGFYSGKIIEASTIRTQSCPLIPTITWYGFHPAKLRKTVSDWYTTEFKRKKETPLPSAKADSTLSANNKSKPANLNLLHSLLMNDEIDELTKRVHQNFIPRVNGGQSFTTCYLEVDFTGAQFQNRQVTPPPCPTVCSPQHPQQQEQCQWRTFGFACTPSNHLTGCGICSRCPQSQCQTPCRSHCASSNVSAYGGHDYCLTGPGSSCNPPPLNSTHYPDPCIKERRKCSPPPSSRRQAPPRPPPPLPPKVPCIPKHGMPCPPLPPPPTRGQGGPPIGYPSRMNGGWPPPPPPPPIAYTPGPDYPVNCCYPGAGGPPPPAPPMNYPGMACMLCIPMCPPQCECRNRRRGRKRKYRQRPGFSC